ncbi:MAG: hypothetical protein ACE5HO_14450 [bacterium]
MIKKVTLSLLLSLGCGFCFGLHTLAAARCLTPITVTDDSPSLHDLIGEKCTLFLKVGGGKYGTLWEVGPDYVVLKVKKGPLYSSEEKYAFSEIDYLEDTDGQRVQVRKSTNSPSAQPDATSKVAPGPTTIGPKPSGKDQALTQKDEKQNLEELLDKLEQEEELQQESRAPSPTRSTLDRALHSNKDDHKTVGPRKSKGATKPGLVIISRKRTPARTSKPNFVRAQTVPKSTHKRSSAKTSEYHRTVLKKLPQAKAASATRISAEKNQIKILRYQLLILFVASLLALMLLVVLKAKGLAGYGYSNRLLFPSQLRKIAGEYGVIDQGSDDGIKLDDVVKFYRKVGRRVNYVGKVKVIKVAENHAAIQLLSMSDHGPMEEGDVGFCDRNILALFARQLRKLTGAIFTGIAKGFDFAAKNISVKAREPEIDVEIIEDDSLINDHHEISQQPVPPQPRLTLDTEAALDLQYIEKERQSQQTNATQESNDPTDRIRMRDQETGDVEFRIFDDVLKTPATRKSFEGNQLDHRGQTLDSHQGEHGAEGVRGNSELGVTAQNGQNLGERAANPANLKADKPSGASRKDTSGGSILVGFGLEG